VISANKYKQQLPSYSLTSRTVVPTDGTCKPGPGAYSPERVSTSELHRFTVLYTYAVVTCEIKLF